MYRYLVLILLFGFATQVSCAEDYKIKRVIDCDTLELTNGQSVNLIGIKCDLLTKEQENRVLQFGGSLTVFEAIKEERAQFLKGLHLYSYPIVKLEFEEEFKNSDQELNAHVHICPVSVPALPPDYKAPSYVSYIDDTFCHNLSLLLVYHGYTGLKLYPRTKYKEELQNSRRDSQKNGRGWWRYKKQMSEEDFIEEKITQLLEKKGVEKTIKNISMPLFQLERHLPLITFNVCFDHEETDCLLVLYDYEKMFFPKMM